MKIIVDTDMGWDDVCSIIFLTRQSNVELLGITITGVGETHLYWGSIIACALVKSCGLDNVVISAGTDKPLKYNNKFPEEFKESMDVCTGLLGRLNSNGNAGLNLDKRPAWQYIYETLKESQDKITILSIGGFTNIATMIDKYSDVDLDKIECVYAMGGAVFVDGNVNAVNSAQPGWDQGSRYSSNYKSEWNFFIDSVAAQKVVCSAIPMMLIPLDVCNHVILSAAELYSIAGSDAITLFFTDLLRNKFTKDSEGISVPLFDIVATAICIGAIEIKSSTEEYLNVETDNPLNENAAGSVCVVDSGQRKIKIAQAVSKFELLEKLRQYIGSAHKQQ